MERRADALREALAKNEEETERWQKYRMEQETAIENLETFAKSLTVDCMVPIGRKAFMPGQLIHTNEVLVGHYQNYFSKCSAHQAQQICKHRIGVAQDHLEELRKEAELWQNKLEKPHMDGALPNEEQREIIEEYDEEAEKRWRMEHKARLKEWKNQERQKRSENNVTDIVVGETLDLDDRLKALEEAEMLEELQEELDSMQAEETKKMVEILRAGQMPIPPAKARVAHVPVVEKKEDTTKSMQTNNRANEKAKPKDEKSVKSKSNVESSSHDEVASTELDPEPTEVTLIKEQAEYLTPADQIGFYEYQIEIVQRKLRTIKAADQEGLEEKMHLYMVLEHLEDLLEKNELFIESDQDAISEADEQKTENENSKATKTTQKRRISFALEDQLLEFNKNESVSAMLPLKKDTARSKDVISLDNGSVAATAVENTETERSSMQKNKSQTILDKVEENLKLAQDCNLIDQILQPQAAVSMSNTCHTLHIQFKHSAQMATHMPDPDEQLQCELATPADFYRLYLKTLDLQTEKSSQNTTFLRDDNREQAYKDPRVEFSKPKTELKMGPQVKPILRNKLAVEKEKRNAITENIEPSPNQNMNVAASKRNRKKKSTTPAVVDEYASAYYQVVHDVAEKSLITGPDPLPPTGKYIDAHAPKKRVSRFKQLRAEAALT